MVPEKMCGPQKSVQAYYNLDSGSPFGFPEEGRSAT